MASSRWDEIIELFKTARGLGPEERAAFLQEHCDDKAVREEVDNLLEVAGESDDFFEQLAMALPGTSGERKLVDADPSPDRDPLSVEGERVDRYLVEEHIGGGGMGVVYRAHDPELDRQVALKFLSPFLSQDHEARERFLREARAVARLNHANICTIHDFCEQEGRPVLVMEYIEGTTLRDRLREGSLPLEDALVYGEQISEALAKAHEAGIIHRDIKPGNIMVDTVGRIKVMDFGLARLHGSEAITKTGSTVGTMAYMAPEQIEGREVDHRVDIFAFGVVLFEMMAGVRPFRGKHEAALMYSIVNEEPISLRTYLPEAPVELVQLFDKVLAKEPEERYSSAGELKQALRSLNYKDTAFAIADTPRIEGAAFGGSQENDSSGSITLPGVIGLGEIALGRRGRLLGAAVLLISAFAYFVFIAPGESGQDLVNGDRVLVVPFENRTGDSTLNLTGWTAADWVTMGISQSGDVEVVPTTTTLNLIGEDEIVDGGLEDRSRLAELAKITNAGVVISGRFIQVGDDIRFETQIVDVQTDEIIHTVDPVRGPQSEPMEVINDLQQNILTVLSIHVSQDRTGELEYFDNPPDYEAYSLFVEGKKRPVSAETFIEYYEEAIEIDPDFLRAKIDLAWGYINTGQPAKADSLFQAVDAERERLSPYHEYYLDYSLHVMAGDRQAAHETAMQWKNIAPNDYLLNFQLGVEGLSLNRPQITIDTYSEFELTGQVSEEWPATDWWFRNFSRAYHLLGEHEKELQKAREGLAYHPESLTLKSCEIEALAALGEIDKVHNVIDESKAIDEPMQGSAGSVMLTASYELRAHGNREASLEIAEDAIEWYEANEPENKSDMASALYRAERWGEAYTIYQELSQKDPGNIRYKAMTGVLAVLTGNDEEAWQVEESLRTVDQDYLFGLHTYSRARIHALLGEREKSVSLIEESFEQGRPLGFNMHRDLAFEPLHDYPPFKELLEPGG